MFHHTTQTFVLETSEKEREKEGGRERERERERDVVLVGER